MVEQVNTSQRATLPFPYSLCHRIATTYAYQYPPVEADDIEGELFVWIVENATSLEARTDGGEDIWAFALKGVAIRYCRIERAARLHIDDQYYYRADDIREVLGAFVHSLARTPYGWSANLDGATVAEDYRGPRDDAANAWSITADLTEAWERLSLPYQRVICARHAFHPGDSPDWEDVAQRVGRTKGESAKRAYFRGVENLTNLANVSACNRERSSGIHAHWNDGPGTRKLSNVEN